MRILIVEDDDMVAIGLCEGLSAAGFSTDRVAAAELVEEALHLTDYDIAIIDIGLPKMDGLELIRCLRHRGITLPILVLTARDAMEDRVAGLDLGADDYMIKPFLLPELMARVRALVRRSRSATSSQLILGNLQLDLGQHTAYMGSIQLDLTGREWDILEQLMLATPKVVTKNKLIENLSRWDREITHNAVEIYISRVRTKLDAAAPAHIAVRTVRGIGYRIEAHTAID